jgi:class 3 adenylate cyclase/predicted ATPase/ABC-type cobalamin/Fe3+-siderophores transport system ATPase subunit
MDLDDRAASLTGKKVNLDSLPSGTEGDLQYLGLARSRRRNSLKALAGEKESSGKGRPPQGAVADTRVNAAAERRQLTVLFCDLVGSTAEFEGLDPEELRGIMRAYHEICSEVVQRYDGHIAQYLGDGLLIYFGYPRAHEDDAERALRAGLGILAALPALNARLAQETTIRLSVRLGVDTGLVVVGGIGAGDHLENLALGQTPNRAARLQALAAPNSFVISERTKQLAGGNFEYADLGNLSLKGVSDSSRTWRVLGYRDAATRFDAANRAGLTPLIGREQEIALLLDRWQLARGGSGQVVVVAGEPGIGKSRILRALRERIDPEISAPLSFQCSPHHRNSALYPLVECFQRALAFAPQESDESKLLKVEAVVAQRYARPPEDVKLLAAVLSIAAEDRLGKLAMTPQRQKEETIRALIDLLAAIARERPALMLFEDLHWADPTTLEALDHLVRKLRGFPLLIVVTHRPEFTANWHSRVTTLALSRLGAEHSAAMVAKLSGGHALPAELARQIVEKTDGVPLFIEELTKVVLEVPGLLGKSGADGLATVPIPATLRDSLMARLDRIPGVKMIAQVCAAIGREFSFETLSAVAALARSDVERLLGRLVESGLVLERKGLPGVSYAFKHALVQDAAYDSLLKENRRTLHAKIANVLQSTSTWALETNPEILAHHYTEAGLVDQAVEYWKRAGQRTAARSANIEAVNHLTKALQLLRTTPNATGRDRQEVSVLTMLGPVLLATKGYAAPEVEETYAEAQKLARDIGDKTQLLAVLLGQFRIRLLQARYSSCEEASKELYAVARQEKVSAYQVEYCLGSGLTALFRGRFRAAGKHLDKALALFDPEQHRSHAIRYGVDLGIASLAYKARLTWVLGHPDQALAWGNKAVTLAQTPSLSLSCAQAMGMLAVLYQVRGEICAAQEWIEKTIDYSIEQGHPYWAAFGRIVQGWLLAKQGQARVGIEQITHALGAYETTGARLGKSWFLLLLTEAYEEDGQIDAGLKVLTGALQHCADSGEGYYAAELRRKKGELLLLQSGAKVEREAEACFRQALALARRQRATAWMLRAATSMARFWIHQGKGNEAHALLAPIYASFTEGLDTADLLTAKQLLDTAASSLR